jgi:hypothetical protein
LPTSSSASAAAYLLRPERSLWLTAWWAALHVVAALSLALICPWPWLSLASLAGSGLLAWRRRPAPPPLIVQGPEAGWGLPQAGLFDLSLTRATRFGSLWAELVFDDPRAPRILLLRDQFGAADWRRLQLALIESQ